MKTAIMGFGNPVRSDDAVGVFVVQQIKKHIPDNEPISVLDMGSSAFEVLFNLRGHRRIIMVDAVLNTDDPVGSVYRVPVHELMSPPREDPLVFLHGMKWNQALAYAQRIFGKEFPHDIQVYLIAVDNTAMGVGLSASAQAGAKKVIRHILEDIKTTP